MTGLRALLRAHPRLALASAIGAIVVIGLAVGLAIGAFGAARQTADASPTLSGSTQPSAAPSPTTAVSTTALPAHDTLLQVSVDGLRMRATASTSADIVRSLDRGEVVRAESGPVESAGYTWYEVVDLDSHSGWVAMGDAGDPWLEAIPTGPATSELLLRFQRDCDVNPRTYGGKVWPPDLTLTADGRVVLWSGGGHLGTGDALLVVRQLSPSGLAQVQRDVLDLPALHESANYVLERLPKSPEPLGHGTCINKFTLGEGTGRVMVTATSWQGEEEGVYWVPSPERRALDELAIHLEEAEVWLGPAAWLEPVAREYASGSYLFWLEPPNDIPPEGVDAPSVTGAAWPFDDPIEQIGEPVGQARCAYLTLGQAFETLRLMRGLGVPTHIAPISPRQLALDGVGYGTFATNGGWFYFWLTPRSPDGYPSCPG